MQKTAEFRQTWPLRIPRYIQLLPWGVGEDGTGAAFRMIVSGSNLTQLNTGQIFGLEADQRNRNSLAIIPAITISHSASMASNRSWCRSKVRRHMPLGRVIQLS